MIHDTIAAISTPLGEGGLAVVRISGSDTFRVVEQVFRPVGRHSAKPSEAASHTIHFGHITQAGRVVDEVLLAVFRAPRSYTREDVAEVSCHGGLLSAKLVLEALLEGGARLAWPGEFTQRAFLNGRIDLAQAEAVADLIHARTELALEAANEQLAGKLSQRINTLRDEIMHVLAHVEAHIDFPEEDIAPASRAELLRRLGQALEFIDELLSTAREGQILRRGLRAAIVGRPNAGKSSLLNQLLGHDRAMVSPIPGTTRDTIEETANVRGIPIVFIDTAGVRDSADPLEREGVRRSRESLARAELVLYMVDGSEPWTEEDELLWKECAGRNRILVWNKMDLPGQLRLPPGLNVPSARVCCLTGEGLEALKELMVSFVWSGQVRPDMAHVLINSRHQEALQRARTSLSRATAALRANESLEWVAADLRPAVNAIGEVVGKTTTEDLLDSIFSQFCLGK